MRQTEDPAKVIRWLESARGDAWRKDKFRTVIHNVDPTQFGAGLFNFKNDIEMEVDLDYYDVNGYLIGQMHPASDPDWFDPCGGKPIDQEELACQLDL